MPVVVVPDADTLFGGTTRALLIFLDYQKVLRVHWSPRILGEMSAALVRTGRKDEAGARANEELMNESLPAALVEQALVDARVAAVAANVADENDAHVAACALELRAGDYYPDTPIVHLVSRNLADYRIGPLAAQGVLVQHPDEFLLALPLPAVAAAFREWRLSVEGPPDHARLLERLARDGQQQTAQALAGGAQAGQYEL